MLNNIITKEKGGETDMVKRKTIGFGISKGSSDGSTYFDLVAKYKDGGTESKGSFDTLNSAKKAQQKLLSKLRK